MSAGEDHYRDVLESLDDGFCVIRLVYDDAGLANDFVFVETNAAFVHHTGLRDAVGRSIRSFHPEHDTFWFEFYARVVETRAPERTQYYANAMGRWYDAHATPFGPREAAQVAIVFKDITQHKRAQEQRDALLLSESAARAQAEAANRAKDEFLATLSHELRTPLQAMLGWLYILRNHELTPERRERALLTVERNTRTQAQMIEDLLDVSRIVSGKLQIDFEQVNLATTLDAALEMVRPTLEKKQLTLTTTLAPVAFVRGEPQRLQQVARNLLSNAVKFTPPAGRIEVSLEVLEDEVLLTVSDDGSGITHEFLPHVFERFQQQESGSTRAHGGLGLGLSITQQLVALHGGSIHVQSGGAGLGASFTVCFPRASEHMPANPLRPRSY